MNAYSYLIIGIIVNLFIYTNIREINDKGNDYVVIFSLLTIFLNFINIYTFIPYLLIRDASYSYFQIVLYYIFIFSFFSIVKKKL